MGNSTMTSSALQLFQFESNEIRVVMRDGEPWWVAKDVCDVLEISNSRDALSKLREYEKDVALTDTLGGKQELAIISESGLYRLVMRSRKEAAERFQDWVCQEVIPSIRKTGLFNTMPFKVSSDSTLVSFEGSDYWVLSTTIAEVFGKEHYNVLRDLEEAKKDVLKFESMSKGVEFKIHQTVWVDKYGRTQKAFKINRAMFDYVVLAYQGDRAKEYRMMFITAFHQMERSLKALLTQQMLYKNPKRQQVYILRNELTGKVKIGITNDIKRRVSELENASGCPIVVERLLPASDNAMEIEQHLHRVFADKRNIGEWFDIGVAEVIEELEKQSVVINPTGAVLMLPSGFSDLSSQ